MEGYVGIYAGSVFSASGDGKILATMTEVAKNVAVAMRLRGERRETPHSMWPDVHPDPSWMSVYVLVLGYSPLSQSRRAHLPVLDG